LEPAIQFTLRVFCTLLILVRISLEPAIQFTLSFLRAAQNDLRTFERNFRDPSSANGSLAALARTPGPADGKLP